jgi:hypothetical protein
MVVGMVPESSESDSPIKGAAFTVNAVSEYVCVRPDDLFTGFPNDVTRRLSPKNSDFTATPIGSAYFKYSADLPKSKKGPKGIRSKPVLVKSNVKYNYRPTSLSRLYR